MAGEPVLVVDDNSQNLKLVRVLLKTEGYEVRTAVDAEDAIRELEGFSPRLILMDLQLPGMDGLELARLLKADPLRRDIAIIAVTAYAMKGDEVKAMAAGCDAYVAKPIDVQTLPLMVREHLDRQKRRSAFPPEGPR
jgi:two-component system cell cycle response regulator DivK